MMKKIICIVLLTHLLYAGDPARINTSTAGTWLTQGYVFESISGSGFSSSIYSRVADLAGTNPAIIYDADHASIGLSYQFESAIKPAWYVDIGHERGRLYLPQSVGIVLPFKNFQIGLGFDQYYNSFLDFGSFEITTVEQPEGTGEFYKIEREYYVIRYSVQLSYPLKNQSQDTNILCLGVRINFNAIDLTDRIYNLETKARGGSFGWSLGLRYDPSANIKIGLFYERNPNLNEKYKFNHVLTGVGRDSTYTVIGNNQVIIASIQPDIYFKTKLPDKINLGFLYRFDKALEMTLEITDVFWQQQDENSLNSIDIAGSLIGHLTENISLSAGILSTERRFDETEYSFDTTQDNLDALFFLAGLNLKYGSFDFDLALLTAAVHGEWRKQNIGKFSLGYSL